VPKQKYQKSNCFVEKMFGQVIANDLSSVALAKDEAKQSQSLKTEIATAPSGPRNDNLLCFLQSKIKYQNAFLQSNLNSKQIQIFQIQLNHQICLDS